MMEMNALLKKTVLKKVVKINNQTLWNYNRKWLIVMI